MICIVQNMLPLDGIRSIICLCFTSFFFCICREEFLPQKFSVVMTLLGRLFFSFFLDMHDCYGIVFFLNRKPYKVGMVILHHFGESLLIFFIERFWEVFFSPVFFKTEAYSNNFSYDKFTFNYFFRQMINL